ncbi:MAG: BREX-1 system adenine-specific DNA-methyltransferase PglX, partial [Candidatus Methanofastidiosa archaeon]|nr:BREX-1 system adenine-specific DNA-methyltransferase PglX [Candidatus Methanofastidiosa archaeon]
IYLSVGYSEREIPSLILKKNLYGLDIDDRAGQLASFALLMKARSKNRRIFRSKPKMNLCSIQESNDISKETIEYFYKGGSGSSGIKKDVEYLIKVFHDAKEYGSILEVKEIDFDALETRIEEIKNNAPGDIFELQHKEVILEKIPPLIEQARIMSRKYDVVCTNPPYMGRKGMNPKLVKHLDERFRDSKTDLFAVFMELDDIYLKNTGYMGMINQHSWMFLSSYEKLREKIISKRSIYSMIHLGPHAFEEIGGEVVQTTTFITRNIYILKYEGLYIRATSWKNAYEKELKLLEAIRNPLVNYRYVVDINKFTQIPGKPIAYWINKGLVEAFGRNKFLESQIEAVKGLDTCDNNTFVRLWHEVVFNKIGMDIEDCSGTYNHKWYPYCKGGDQRKWYGNYENVVLWENNGYVLRNLRDSIGRIKSRPQNTKYYFKRGITWSTISSSGKISMREMDNAIFGGGGSGLFTSKKLYEIFFALLNSRITLEVLEILNPTLNFLVGDLKKIPFISVYNCHKSEIHNIVNLNIQISKTEWDSFETSWDFRIHPFLKHLDLGENHRLSCIFTIWETETEEAFNQLKANEEELNRIFIEIYGLQDELTPEVADEDITISKADRERDVKSFISYAVGCMFGRYSLDEDGLVNAGGDFDDWFRIRNAEWEIKTEKGWKKSSINIAEHNVIPIADGDYFEDDILKRLVEFVKISFGAKTLEENLEYIAETLGQKTNETSRQAIRRYFLKDFYKDHVRTYKKRPIYWLFDSGRQNGFKALIYMHRYNPYTVARVRTDYLHTLQKKYEAEINHLDILIDSEISNREKAAARKNKEAVLKQIQECRSYDEAIAHVANQKVGIDLDDGVKVNYAKFQGIE